LKEYYSNSDKKSDKLDKQKSDTKKDVKIDKNLNDQDIKENLQNKKSNIYVSQ